MNILSRKEPKAIKQHRCDWCGGIIEIGEVYDSSFNEHCGDVYTWKNHKRCMAIMQHFNAFDDYDDGVTESDFVDIINDAYWSLNLENNLSDAPTFSERLNVVCDKYLTD